MGNNLRHNSQTAKVLKSDLRKWRGSTINSMNWTRYDKKSIGIWSSYPVPLSITIGSFPAILERAPVGVMHVIRKDDDVAVSLHVLSHYEDIYAAVYAAVVTSGTIYFRFHC